MRALTEDELELACVAGGGSSAPTVVTVTKYRGSVSTMPASALSKADFGSGGYNGTGFIPPPTSGTRILTPGHNWYVVSASVHLSTSQQNTLSAIVDYGMSHSYSPAVISAVANDAFLESSLNNSASLGSYTGLFMYSAATWAQNGESGSINSQADQITAMFNDVGGYVARYNSAISTNAYDIATDNVTFGEYVDIKHNGGNSQTNWDITGNSGIPMTQEWNNSAATLGFAQFKAT